KTSAKVRTILIDAFIKALREYDLNMGPVTTSTDFKIGDRNEYSVEMYVSESLIDRVNLEGLSSQSFLADIDSTGMPIGLQLIGKHMNESTLYQVAYDFEKNHDYVNQVPEF